MQVVEASEQVRRSKKVNDCSLGAYIGLSLRVVGLGIATTYAPARDVMLVFAALSALAIAASVRAVRLGSTRATAPPRHQRRDGGPTGARIAAESSR